MQITLNYVVIDPLVATEVSYCGNYDECKANSQKHLRKQNTINKGTIHAIH